MLYNKVEILFGNIQKVPFLPRDSFDAQLMQSSTTGGPPTLFLFIHILN